MKNITLFIYFTLLASLSYANEKIKFSIEVPKTVIAKKTFIVSFKIDYSDSTCTENDFSDFTPPSFEGFIINQKPATRRTTISTPNFTKKSFSYSFTSIVHNDGEFYIPEASIIIKGKLYQTTPVTIKALPADQIFSEEEEKRIFENDVFLKTIISDDSTQINQPITLDCKLYYLEKSYSESNIDSIRNIKLSLPENEFKVKDVTLQLHKEWELEHLNGKNYITIHIGKYILYPLKTGTLQIGSVQLDSYTNKRKYDSPDYYFDKNNKIVIHKVIHSNSLKIHVRE